MSDDVDTTLIDEIRTAYAFEGAALDFGAAVVDDVAHPDATVRIPMSAMNRHGLVAGATGIQSLPRQLNLSCHWN